MRKLGLAPLYDTTIELFTNPGEFGPGLDWVDKVLPHFTDACIHDVAEGSSKVFELWSDWLSGTGVEQIRDAGEADAFEWRRSWLKVLIETSSALHKEGVSDTVLESVAEKAAAAAPEAFSSLPHVFWVDLVHTLAQTQKSISTPDRRIEIAFPLVLSERMVVDGDNIDVLLADFVLEPSPYGGTGAYTHPAQMATRCVDPRFFAVFKQASAEIDRLSPPASVGSVRVRIEPRRPEHEVFLHKLILRGPSGGGALAAGLYLLSRPANSVSRNLAVSYALTAPGQTVPDGFCHAVGGAYEKVRGCAKAGIGTLIVAEEQASQVKFYGSLQSVSIVGVSALPDLLRILDSEVTETVPALPTISEDESGVLPLSSSLYMERKSDEAFHAALAQRPMIVLVKGARQIGKTSLLVRGVEQVRKQNVKLVYVDLQSIGRDSMKTQKDLFFALARIFSRELKLDVTMDDMYDERDGPNKNFENFLFRYALKSPVIWFMDEVDRLFDFDYYTDVFSLMRSWHNRRPVHSELYNLTLVLSYATETHLLIEDVYQSPFNIGTKIELEDYSPEQVSELNFRLGRPLKVPADLERFIQLVGGHPHLVCRGLSWMAQEHKDVEQFAACACMDIGPFGTHLRRLRLVTKNHDQLEVIHSVLRGSDTRNNDAFLHLRSAGVVIGDDCQSIRMRCGIYADYLRNFLHPEEQLAPASKQGRRSIWQALRKIRL